MFRALFQNEARDQITGGHKNNPNYSHLPLVAREIGQSIRAEAHGQISHTEIANNASESDCGGETHERYLEDAGGQDEKFERGRRREHGGKEHAAKPVALDPVADGGGALSDFAVKGGFLDFAGQQE